MSMEQFETQVELVGVAVTGTHNILRACTEAKVRRVVVVSSVVHVIFNLNWPKGQFMDESSWSDKEHCKRTKKWYFLAKTEAEGEALAYAKENGLDIVTVCPSLVIGPMLQFNRNSSSMVLVRLLKREMNRC